MFQISTFCCDITPPVGAALCGGTLTAVKTVDDPQYALGFVLHGHDAPVVLVAMDCLAICDGSHDRFAEALAAAAGTSPHRVLLTSVHQHDAPWHVPEAQHLLDENNLDYAFCNASHFERVLADTVGALQDGLNRPQRITHIGVGHANVDRVASNRRILGPDGKVQHMRHSRCFDPEVRAAPEGLIDPRLTALSLFDGDQPVLGLSHYATHPMSSYGQGRVSSDFCGLARARRQAAEPENFQVFVNGCAGNIAAGKYNDGSPGVRDALTGRMEDAMTTAARSMRRQPLSTVRCKHVPMHLPVRNEPGFREEDCREALRQAQGAPGDGPGEATRPGRIMTQELRNSILTLLWRTRAPEPIDVPVMDLGIVKLVLLPGEPFIEYQLAAQQMCPDTAVVVLGYGNGGPGYVCTDIAYDQGGYESQLPAYTGRGAESIVRDTLREALA